MKAKSFNLSRPQPHTVSIVIEDLEAISPEDARDQAEAMARRAANSFTSSTPTSARLKIQRTTAGLFRVEVHMASATLRSAVQDDVGKKMHKAWQDMATSQKCTVRKSGQDFEYGKAPPRLPKIPRPPKKGIGELL